MAEITGSPYPLELGGTEYLVSPLTDGDISELDNWLQARYISRIRESLAQQYDGAENIPDAEYTRAMTLAGKEALGISWMSGEGARLMASVDGISRVLWQMIKRRQPDVTHAFIREQCYSPVTAKLAGELFQKLNLDPVLRATEEGREPGKLHRKNEKHRRRKKKYT